MNPTELFFSLGRMVERSLVVAFIPPEPDAPKSNLDPGTCSVSGRAPPPGHGSTPSSSPGIGIAAGPVIPPRMRHPSSGRAAAQQAGCGWQRRASVPDERTWRLPPSIASTATPVQGMIPHRRQHPPDQLYGCQGAFPGRVGGFDRGWLGADLNGGKGFRVPVTTGVGRRVLFGPTLLPARAAGASAMLLPMGATFGMGNGPCQGSAAMPVTTVRSPSKWIAKLTCCG